MSDIPTALAAIDAFAVDPWQNVAWQLDRAQTLARLRTLIQTPQLFNQRGLNACAPAVFFRTWLARDPLAVANFGCKLLRDGSAPIGSLTVAAGWKLLQQNYAALRAATDAAHPNSTPETAEWMLMCALRDSENVWLDYVGEPFTLSDKLAGMTLPYLLTSWFNATGLYSNLSNETSVIEGDRQRLLSIVPLSNLDIILFIQSNLLYDLQPSVPATVPPTPFGFFTPDHYVLMGGPASQWAGPDWINIDCWSWGRSYGGWEGTEQFFSRYFGMIVGTTW